MHNNTFFSMNLFDFHGNLGTLMPLASNIIAFVFPLGFLGGHIGLEHLHVAKKICWSIFTMVFT
jgi:hypothetical protein